VNEETAARVRLSFEPTDESAAAALDTDRYRSFLRRSHAGPISVGEEWAEFVSRGCGSTRDVTLRVESVDGGGEVGDGTVFAFEPRA
jgi:hypothetical protein